MDSISFPIDGKLQIASDTLFIIIFYFTLLSCIRGRIYRKKKKWLHNSQISLLKRPQRYTIIFLVKKTTKPNIQKVTTHNSQRGSLVIIYNCISSFNLKLRKETFVFNEIKDFSGSCHHYYCCFSYRHRNHKNIKPSL